MMSTAENIHQKIKDMHDQFAKINPEATQQNQSLLATLASYQTAKAKLLKTGGSLDTVSAALVDEKLKRGSIDISYYIWLSLAISILLIAIRKIK